ncbi:uncharacterized protein LOC116844390 isoform X5 [Odontomachus brunneus]|uniref:uncharacterized protein LOC116844390 isoform X5 n=1 Tax=Odontomachus brunneus TaxID=486640 RepID=UPI0013F26414|nr:uncharacterized protein LOC116844390 isoform X5 [Odontomachus brunneus]
MPHIMEMIFEERFKDRVFTIALLDSMRVIYWKDKVEKYDNDREKLPFLYIISMFDCIPSRYFLVSKVP